MLLQRLCFQPLVLFKRYGSTSLFVGNHLKYFKLGMVRGEDTPVYAPNSTPRLNLLEHVRTIVLPPI
jgi:hypothetical protein